MISIGLTAASVPYAAVDVTVPAPLAVAWLPIVAAVAWALTPTGRSSETQPGADGERSAAARILRPRWIGVAVVVVLAAFTVAGLPDGRLHVTVLDVGQGDAILVESPAGATMLVDGGPDPDRTLRRLGAALPFFERTIDVVVVSHPHQDHVAGLVDVLGRFDVGVVVHAGIPFDNPAYEQLLADATASGVDVVRGRAGTVIRLDATTIVEVVYPTDDDAAAPLPDGDINNGSLVLLLRHGAFDALLTGDAEEPVERTLVQRELVGPVELLKVGHHGSSSSSRPEFLARTRPAIAVISAGAGNEYGHPTAQTLAALANVDAAAVFRTDLHGDVEVVADAATWYVRSGGPPAAGRSQPSEPGADGGGSIGLCQSLTERPHARSSPTPSCRAAWWSTRRAWLESRSPPAGCSPRRAYRSTARSSKRRRCCTTSTRPRSSAAVVSTGSLAPACSRRRATRSWRSRSPPIRSRACSTTIGSLGAGRRSSWPSRTGTLPRSS
jgi:beta-lactamase superfamily II metal-dependent hydrolase